MKRRITAALLTAALTAGLIGFTPFAEPAYAAASFNDTNDHWAKGEVLAGVQAGYINGYSDGTFRPENSITRAEFVKIINAARNYTETTNVPYKDVVVTEWYFGEVQKAQKAGYIQGDGEYFRPNAQISREEVAVILNRVAPGGDSSYNVTVSDAAKINSWASAAVNACFSKGYINGYDDGKFYPQNPLKRGEAVKIINRLLGLSPISDAANLSISNLSLTTVLSDEATMSLTANKDATAYWVVLKGDGATVPTAENVIAGKTADNKSPVNADSKAVYANTETTYRIRSLEVEQSYKICAVLKDASGATTTVSARTFTTKTLGDTGENWITEFKVGSVGDSTARLTVTSSQSGTLYWVVAPESAKTPAQERLRNGRDANNDYGIKYDSFSVTAKTSKYVDISGLSSGTNYRLFGCVYESGSSSSAYSIVKVADFKTTGSDNVWIESQAVSGTAATSATFTSKFTKYGSAYTYYWVILKSGQSAPTGTNIRTVNITSGSTAVANVVAKDYDPIPSAKSLTYTANGLTAGETYRIYGVVYYETDKTYSAVHTSSSFTATTAASYVPDLPELTLTPAPGGAPYALTANERATSGGKKAYSFDVDDTATQITVTAKAPTGATVMINNETVATDEAKGSKTVTLNAAGSNTTISVTVTATASGKSNVEYTLTIKRAAAPEAKISKIEVSNVANFEKFSSETLRYDDVQALPGVTEVTLEITFDSGVSVNVISTASSSPKSESGGSWTVPLNTGAGASTTVTITASKANAPDKKIYITINNPTS